MKGPPKAKGRQTLRFAGWERVENPKPILAQPAANRAETEQAKTKQAEGGSSIRNSISIVAGNEASCGGQFGDFQPRIRRAPVTILNGDGVSELAVSIQITKEGQSSSQRT